MGEAPSCLSTLRRSIPSPTEAQVCSEPTSINNSPRGEKRVRKGKMGKSKSKGLLHSKSREGAKPKSKSKERRKVEK